MGLNFNRFKCRFWTTKNSRGIEYNKGFSTKTLKEVKHGIRKYLVYKRCTNSYDSVASRP